MNSVHSHDHHPTIDPPTPPKEIHRKPTANVEIKHSITTDISKTADLHIYVLTQNKENKGCALQKKTITPNHYFNLFFWMPAQLEQIEQPTIFRNLAKSSICVSV